ncbi:MAG: glycoside hydrolase family 15 [Nostocoides sp.]
MATVVAGLCAALAVQVAGPWVAMPGRATGTPVLHTQPDWYVARDAAAGRTNAQNLAWVRGGSVPGAGTAYEPMVQAALLDLRRLSLPGGAMPAGAGATWNHDWPRDTAFVAVALDRAGHHDDAVAMLSFLAGQPAPEGTLAARYRLDGGGPPDGRPAQADGPGWVLWAVDQLVQGSTDPTDPSRPTGPDGDREWEQVDRVSLPVDVRTLADRSLARILSWTGNGRWLPPPTPDYWEMPASRVSLGEVAPLVAGLQSAARLYTKLGDDRRAAQSRAAAGRLGTVVAGAFGPSFQRFGDSGGRDAALSMLMPPFVTDGELAVGPAVGRIASAWLDYQQGAVRSAGGLAPGTGWFNHGESWTPETALVAYAAAASGRPVIARRWMDWLAAHRTPWGALPEKVLANGQPAGPAPLAWTDALVVLTAYELDRHP